LAGPEIGVQIRYTDAQFAALTHVCAVIVAAAGRALSARPWDAGPVQARDFFGLTSVRRTWILVNWPKSKLFWDDEFDEFDGVVRLGQLDSAD
jgi:hypothetical protein